MKRSFLKSLIWVAVLVAAMFVSSIAYAQPIVKRYPGVCTNVSGLLTATEEGFIPCSWYQQGSAPGSPTYVTNTLATAQHMEIKDWNSNLELDIVRVSAIVAGLINTHNAAVTASTVWGYDGVQWYPMLASGGVQHFDLRRINGIAPNVDGGNIDTGTLTMTVAADDLVSTNLTAILADTAIMSAWTTNTGLIDATTLRLTVATDDVVSTQLGLLEFVLTQADGQATSLDGLVTTSFMYGYNGATFDMLRLGATNELQVTDVATRPGEDSANDWRKAKKEAIAVYTPAKDADTAIDDAAGGDVGDEVYPPTEVIGYVNWCVIFKNEGGGAGDILADAAVLVSPSNAAGEWEDLTFTVCDTLASGGGTCSYCCENCSHRYVKAEALCGAGDDTTVTVWITGNVN